MTYFIFPSDNGIDSPNYTDPLSARLDSVPFDPFIPSGLTIQWRQNGIPLKTGSTSDPFFRSINTTTPGDIVFDTTDTGSFVDFIIDPAGTPEPSLTVILKNELPDLQSAGPLTDAFGRTTGRPTFNWIFSDPEGESQFFFRVKVGSLAGGSDLHDTGKVLSSSQSYTIPSMSTAIPVGMLYFWTIEVGDGEKTNPFDPDIPEPSRVTVSASGSARVNTPSVVTNVKINGVSGGATISGPTSLTPTISWTYFDIDGQPQQSYRVIVARDSGLSDVLWDSGIQNDSSNSTIYNFNLTGESMESHILLYVGVRTRDTFEDSNLAIETFNVSNAPLLTSATVDDRVNPLNVRNNFPFFNWTYADLDNDLLTGYEIRVADNDADIGTDSFVGNIWNPGPRITPLAYKTQFNDDGTAFPGCVEPKVLESTVKYFFQVQVYDEFDTSLWFVGCFRLNSPPTATSLSIIPAAPFTSDDLLASYEFVDDIGDVESTANTQIKWFRKKPGESVFSEVTSARNLRTVSKSLTFPREEWYFTVRPHDGFQFSETEFASPIATILNRTPTASALIILPSKPQTADQLEAIFALSDPDNDSIVATIRWYKNGVEQVALKNTKIVPPSVTSLDDEWYFTVLPSDGYDNGPLARSPAVIIINTPPVIISMAVDGKLLPKDLENPNPTFSWVYQDDDLQPQEKFQIIVGTKPARTRKVAIEPTRALTSSVNLGLLTTCGDEDGIVSKARSDGELVSGNEIFNSGIITSEDSFFQYATEGFVRSQVMNVGHFESLSGYVVGADLQTMLLSAEAVEGTATGKFVYQTAFYDVELTYIKEQAKQSAYKLVVDGVVVGQVLAELGSGPATHVFNAIRIESGSFIGVAGSANDSGAKAKFRQLKFVPVSQVEIPAGSFATLSGYLQDGTGGIKLAGLAGTATTRFDFPSGTYDLEIIYVTETAGNPVVTVSVNNAVASSFTFETGASTRSAFVAGVDINRGDTIKISGTRSGAALARVKKIIFRPKETVQVGARFRDGLTYFASVRVFDGRSWSDWFTTKFTMAGSAWQQVSNARGWTIEARLRVTVPVAEE